MDTSEKDHEHEVHDEDAPVDEPVDEEIVHLRGPNGFVWAMALPLSEGIASQVAKSELVRVKKDGTPWEPSDDHPELDLESEGDRHARERAAGLEYARLKHEHPDADPLELRDEAAEATGDVIPDDAPEAGHDDKPKPAASKGVWVHYAQTQGMSHEDADGMTKAALIEKFG